MARCVQRISLLIAVASATTSCQLADGTPAATLPSVDPARTAPDSLIADLRIGAADATGATTFSQITAIDVDSRGNIHVLLGQDHEVRVFTPDGRPLRTLGGLGAGPGEFRTPAQLGIDRDDRIWVYDANLSRYSVYDSSGAHLVDHPQAKPSPACSDRRLRFAANGDVIRQHSMGLVLLGTGRGGVIPCRVSRFNRDFQAVDSFVSPMPSRRPAALDGAWLAYEQRTTTAIDPGGAVWRGSSDSLVIARIAFRGDTTATARADVSPQPISREGLVRAQANHDAAWSRSGNPRFQAKRRGTPAATEALHKPLFTYSTVDDLGRLWVALSGPVDGAAWAFEVFAGDGARLGRVGVGGPLLIPSAAGDDLASRMVVVRGGYVYGVAENDDGSEAIVRLRMLDPT